MSKSRPTGGSFVDVTAKQSGRLLFRFDAERDIVHIADRKRGIDEEIDLREYRSPGEAPGMDQTEES